MIDSQGSQLRLAIFTDEISKRSERAIELAKSWGVSHVEVRSLDLSLIHI